MSQPLYRLHVTNVTHTLLLQHSVRSVADLNDLGGANLLRDCFIFRANLQPRSGTEARAGTEVIKIKRIEQKIRYWSKHQRWSLRFLYVFRVLTILWILFLFFFSFYLTSFFRRVELFAQTTSATFTKNILKFR